MMLILSGRLGNCVSCEVNRMKICNDKITLDDELDRDGDMEIVTTSFDHGEDSVWINKDEAVAIVEHLTRVFGISR